MATKAEFTRDYCARSGISESELLEKSVVLPCACGDESCSGWAVVWNHPTTIASHMELYEPSVEQAKGADHA